VKKLTATVKSLTKLLAKKQHELMEAKAALLRHRDLRDYDLTEFKAIKSKESHRKHVVRIQAAIRKQRAILRQQQAQTAASNERLSKYMQRKKRLGMNWAHYLRMARKATVKPPPARAAAKGPTAAVKRPSPAHAVVKSRTVAKPTAVPATHSRYAAFPRATRAMQQAMREGRLEKELAPKVAQLRGLLSGSALQNAINHVVYQTVASKVNDVFKKNPQVRAVINRAVTDLMRKFSLGRSVAMKRKALAKAEAAAAVRKVTQAREVLKRANHKLSHALKTKGSKKALSLADIALLQRMMAGRELLH